VVGSGESEKRKTALASSLVHCSCRDEEVELLGERNERWHGRVTDRFKMKVTIKN
jgi:hypothetical protein